MIVVQELVSINTVGRRVRSYKSFKEITSSLKILDSTRCYFTAVRRGRCLIPPIQSPRILPSVSTLFQLHLDVDFLVDSASAYYFPFEDAIRAVLLAVSRDDTLRANSTVCSHAPIPLMRPPPPGPAGSAAAAANATTKQALEAAGVAPSTSSTTVPLSGVVPFKGLAAYAAPLTFVYGDEAPMAAVLKSMWQRHWCKLNALRSDGGCLPQLAQQFEELLQAQDPNLFFHMTRLSASPLTIALPWIHSAFVCLLPPGEVLVLWDRILAADSLDLLPVLAAAIFVYRSRSAKEATSSTELAAVFNDGMELKVGPLLQHFLFPSPVPVVPPAKLNLSTPPLSSSSSSTAGLLSAAPTTTAAAAPYANRVGASR
jgi:hypothetical protein